MNHGPSSAPAVAGLPQRILEVARHPRVIAIFGADLRSLALLRIVLATIVLIDLVGRAQHLRLHYTDAGVLPRSVLLQTLNPWRWSFSVVSGSLLFEAVVFIVTALGAIGLLVGYRTRLVTFIVWAMVVSIQVRNPLVASAVDSLLRLLLFWSLFLPLGARWSIDQKRITRSSHPAKWVLSVATVGLYAQIAFMYWFTALLKTGDEWRTDGTALYYALGARHLTTDFGDFLFQYESLLRVLTYVSYGLEVVAPILLFSPVLAGPIRTAAVFALMSFHLGILLTLDLGIFPLTSAFSMVCFLPTWFWDRLPRWKWDIEERHSTVSRARAFIVGAGAPIGSLLAYRGHGTAAGNSSTSSPDVDSGHWEPALPRDSNEGDSGSKVLLARPFANVMAALSLLFVFGWNLTSVSGFTMPEGSTAVGFTTGLYQRWDMFSPRPVKQTIWYVYRGELADGTELDLLPTIVRDDLNMIAPLSWEEPEDINGGLYGDKYWRKYVDAVSKSYRPIERQYFAEYICQTWNGHYGGDIRLQEIDVFQLEKATLPDYERGGTARRMVATYACS